MAQDDVAPEFRRTFAPQSVAIEPAHRNSLGSNRFNNPLPSITNSRRTSSDRNCAPEWRVAAPKPRNRSTHLLQDRQVQLAIISFKFLSWAAAGRTANEPDDPRKPDAFVVGYYGTYTVDETAKIRQTDRARCHGSWTNCGSPARRGYRLHGRVQVVLVRLVEEPDVTRVAGTAPVVVGTVLPAIEDRFELPLIVGAPERERVLRPDPRMSTICRRPRGTLPAACPTPTMTWHMYTAPFVR
jgi:hypothetical protein